MTKEKFNRERVEQIARSKTNLSAKQIEKASDRELWDQIYSQPKPKIKDQRPSIFPTGFSKQEKDSLIEKAKALGFQVNSDVRASTKYVVTGDKPGKGRLSKAKQHGCEVLTHAQFMVLATLGEVGISDTEARELLEQ